MSIDNDPPPAPPQRPDNAACCDTGCIPCVFDVYDEHLDDYRSALRKWRERQPTVGKQTALKVFATLAVQGAMPQLARQFTASGGYALEAEFAPTNALLARILKGELADVAILTKQAVHQMMVDGLFLAGSHVDLAVSRVGIAVKAGAKKPDISTVEALKATLLAASSIAYSRIGASGIFFAELIRRLGIDEEVDARATIVPGGFTAQWVADGKVQLAVQQLSELRMVPGVDIVGALPEGAQSASIFSGAVLTHSLRHDDARALLRFLASGEALPELRAWGLGPAADL
jgi:molybdate transport system substrate-binding protein